MLSNKTCHLCGYEIGQNDVYYLSGDGVISCFSCYLRYTPSPKNLDLENLRTDRHALNAQEWLNYSRSIWNDILCDPEERNLWKYAPLLLPVALVERLLDCLLHNKGVVLDPFVGVGSTLLAACKKGHSGVGFDIFPEFCLLTQQRLKKVNNPTVTVIKEEISLNFPEEQQTFYIVNNDPRRLLHYLSPNSVDIVVTSPPHWTIRGEVRTVTFVINDLVYSISYDEFLRRLGEVFAQVAIALKPNAICAVVTKDLRFDEFLIPYHIDISNLMKSVGMELKDIIVWDRSKEWSYTIPWGYPDRYRTNILHEFILLFRKRGN